MSRAAAKGANRVCLNRCFISRFMSRFDERPQSAAVLGYGSVGAFFGDRQGRGPRHGGAGASSGSYWGGTCGGEGNPPFDMLVLMCLFSNATNEIEWLPRIAALLPCFPVLF